MNKIKFSLILVNLVLLIAYFNWSVFEKEKTIKQGKLVLLPLAPVDPRSLMQGDYMNLNYEVNDLGDSTIADKRGYCILRTNVKGFAERIRFQKNLQPLGKDELAIKYFSEALGSFTRIHVGAESYFFEEGQAKRFENAKYGGLRIDDMGNSVLVGVYDANFKKIGY